MTAGRRPGRLLCLGNAVVDLAMRVAELPPRGGDAVASRWELAAGGAFNVMAAAARQGLAVVYAGARGTGPFADLVRRAFEAEGITAAVPPAADADTGFDVAVTDAGGERTFLTTIGAEARLAAGSLAALHARPGDVVYVSGYALLREPNRGTILDWLERLPHPVPVAADPGPLAAQLGEDTQARLAACTAWWTCNEREAAVLTGTTDPHLAATLLAARTRPAPSAETVQTGTARTGTAGTGTAQPRDVGPTCPGLDLRGAVVRLGARGCLVCPAGGSPVLVPGFPVAAVDTNGAGDAHAGVFLAGLAAGRAPLDAARRAGAAAALAVTRHGPATAPDAATLDAYLAHLPAA